MTNEPILTFCMWFCFDFTRYDFSVGSVLSRDSFVGCIGLTTLLVRDHPFLRSRRWFLIQIILDDFTIAEGFDGRFLVRRAEGAIPHWRGWGAVVIVVLVAI